MEKPKTLSPELSKIWDEVANSVRDTIGSAGLEALCSQIHMARQARDRVNEEGIVVTDPKGNPVPHPAIQIEKLAQTEIRNWMKEFKRFAS